jgi:glycosyltransferase involved in cell wall biosynthesis
MKNKSKLKLSIGIPTYNSSKYLQSCINSVINLRCLDELIISDDSSDKNELEQIKRIVGSFEKKINKEIKVFTNPRNLGAYENKLNLISNSKNSNIYVLDSDNIAGSNLDRVIDENTNDFLNDSLLIQPNTMYQFWNYRRMAKISSKFDSRYIVQFFKRNTSLDIEKIQRYLLLDSGGYDINNYSHDNRFIEKEHAEELDEIINKWIFWILNCGNFIASKERFLQTSNHGLKIDRKLRSVDAIVFAYYWLSEGNEIKILKDFYHHHRKRNDSVSFIESDNSKIAIEHFINEVLSLN